MRTRRHLAFTISVAILFGLRTVSASAKDLPCSDLLTVKPARLITILDQFSHGTGCYSDDEDNPKECDWKVSITDDRKLSDDRRLVGVFSGHTMVLGTWADVFVFGCRSGKVAVVFSKTSRGDDIEEASSDKLVLKGPQWAYKDAQCCPSLEERKVYVWNNEKQTYVLDHKESSPIAKP
jgi:hypothetical protein